VIPIWEPRDLNVFLGRLLAGASDAGADDGSLVPIPTAAKRASCSAMEIVRLILDRKLVRVMRRPDAAGYLSVLVDPEEIKPFVQGQADGSLSLREVERRLVTATRVIKALIEHGHLPSHVEINPVNRCPRQVVKQDDLNAFMSRYAILHGTGKEQGVHHMRLKSALRSCARVDRYVPSQERENPNLESEPNRGAPPMPLHASVASGRSPDAPCYRKCHRIPPWAVRIGASRSPAPEPARP
jgi:hypothetical protein